MAELQQLVSRGAVGPLRLLVLQPTPYCNLDCAYCYLPHRNDRRRMSDAVLDAVAQRWLGSALVDDPAKVTVCWHGGEPMTLPPGWYAAAFARLEEGAGRPLRHAFQTNALGLDDRWLDLWRRWGVQVGISLDGPADLHDRARRTRSGTGSHALTLAGVARLRDAGAPFHVISVLGAASLAAPDRLFEFYADHGITDVAFNVEEEEGAHRDSSLNRDGIETAYAAFLDRFQARMAAAPGAVRVREVEGVRGLIRTPRALRARNPQTMPLQIVSVAADGGVSTFSPELLGAPAQAHGDFLFGNVCTAGPEDMLAHPGFQAVHREIAQGVQACAAGCGYFEVCGGGAPANKFFEHGHFAGTETLYCRLARQTTLESVLRAMEGSCRGAA